MVVNISVLEQVTKYIQSIFQMIYL